MIQGAHNMMLTQEQSYRTELKIWSQLYKGMFLCVNENMCVFPKLWDNR